MTDLVSTSVLDHLARYESKDIARLSPGARLWEIRTPPVLAGKTRSQLVTECRRDIFGAILSSDLPTFMHHDDPIGYDLPGSWVQHGRAWQVPRDLQFDTPQVESWLDLGNWLLYTAPIPIEIPGRGFVGNPHTLPPFLDQQSVQVLIDSFHDNTVWVVGLLAA